MSSDGICIHEGDFLDQSVNMERLATEMKHNKEKLDELKEDNRRMDGKLDDIKDCVNELIVKSKTDDDKLEKKFSELRTDIENRLVAIETEQKVLKEQSDINRDNTNLKISRITVIFTVICGVITALTFYFSYMG